MPLADGCPAWSPDGRFIAFVRSGQAEPGFYVVPALGGSERKVAAIPVFPTHVPPITVDWSPDAKWLVITDTSVRPPPLALVSVDDGQKRPLTSPSATSYGDFEPAFSPDGRWLAFLRAQGVGVTKLHVLPMKSDFTPEAEPKILLPEAQTVA